MTSAEAPRVSLTIDDQEVEVPTGMSVAAAVFNYDLGATRRSVRGSLRTPLCGMGTCFECRVTIDGDAHVRSCTVICRAGMQVTTGAHAS